MKNVSEIAKLLRSLSLTSTSRAGSGHPTSCLSAADLMAVLFQSGHFTFDIDCPDNPWNDRLIFSKGHAAPLLYAMWALTEALPINELDTLRRLNSRLEGHPTMKFPYTEVPTGSLGQGLSAGVGMALHAKYIAKTSARTYVLLGDSEMAEGSVWEAMQIAAHYKLDNLVGILDANRLGQRGETLHGHDLTLFEAKAEAFGWYPLVIDGHNIEYIDAAYSTARGIKDKPVIIIAKTFKGYGIAALQDHEGFHGVPVKETELAAMLMELGPIDTPLIITLPKPTEAAPPKEPAGDPTLPTYEIGTMMSTREAYGFALAALAQSDKSIVALDAETSNSTFAAYTKKSTPEQFFEMYIAEQNMVGVATGLARRGMIPFASTFAAFFTRAFDQIRMAAYGYANIKLVGSHAGISIGEDGTSQMGLEDIAMMRAVYGSTILYPSDAVSTTKLVDTMARHTGITYLRTTRGKTPTLYAVDESFVIGGCKVHGQTEGKADIVIIAAGITVHEALKAQKMMAEKGKNVIVIDLYFIKPLDSETLTRVTEHAEKIVVVEDHYAEGGIAEAVHSSLANRHTEIVSLAVRKMPQSGTPEELLAYAEIDAAAIMRAIS